MLIVVLVVYGIALLIAVLLTCNGHRAMDQEAKKYTGGSVGNTSMAINQGGATGYAGMPMYQGGAMIGNTPSYSPAPMANPQPYQPMYGAKAPDLPPGFSN